MNIPDDLRYSSDHEWVRRDGDVVTIGITDYAQDSLGDVVFVELPDVGTDVSANESFTEVESTQSVSDIYAPVAGTIAAVNEQLDDTPELVNSDPYGDGWIAKIAVSDDAGLSNLMDYDAYQKLCAEEA